MLFRKQKIYQARSVAETWYMVLGRIQWFLFFYNLESQFVDEFQGAECRVSVVCTFFFGEFIIGDEAGMRLEGVVAFGTVRPVLREAVLCPHFVDIACHLFGQFRERFR